MACIQTIPGCALTNDSSSPLGRFGATIGIISGAGSAVGVIVKVIGAGIGGGILAAVVVAIASIVIVGLYALDRCTRPEGQPTCVAGVVSGLRPCFSEAYETAFPFAALPNRVDITVKSFYWGFVEQSNAFVYCTNEPFPRNSEIIRTYYYTEKLCAAETGAQIGVGIGAAAGIIAAAAVVVAIGCASFWLCLLAILIAVIIVLVAAFLGAFAGGNIGRATADDTPPSGTGSTNTSTEIRVGHLITSNGNMVRRDEENGANVYWFVNSTTIHGEVAPGTPEPFSYCEIDEQLAMDACPVIIG